MVHVLVETKKKLQGFRGAREQGPVSRISSFLGLKKVGEKQSSDPCSITFLLKNVCSSFVQGS